MRQANARRDVPTATPSFISVKASRTTAFEVISRTAASDADVIPMTLEWDTLGDQWDSGNNAIVVTQIGLSGLIILTGQVEYETNAAGGRGAIPIVNGVRNATCIQKHGGAVKPSRVNMCIVLWDVEVGDTFQLGALQNSGGPLDVTYASLEMVVLP